MDNAWRAFRELLGELVQPSVAAASGTPLRPSQVRLLSLTPVAGMRVTDLAARVGMTKQALGELVATLQEAGLVEVTVDERDRRVRLVRPTAAGRRLPAPGRVGHRRAGAALGAGGRARALGDLPRRARPGRRPGARPALTGQLLRFFGM